MSPTTSMSLTALSFTALGTTVTVVATHNVDDAVATVRDEIAAIDATCSRFRPDSELSVLNRAPRRPVKVSPLLVDAVGVAMRAASVTDGIVAPTVGTAMRAMGYDRDFALVAREGPASFEVRAVPAWRTVRVDRTACTIHLPAGLELDLGATAKAWCADRAATAAARASGAGILVSLGGDVATAGVAPDSGWTVRIADDHADDHSRGEGPTIAVTSGGVATSGTTVRRWARGDIQLHHIVDPRTGRPAQSPWRTASVAAASCTDANIASTASVVLGNGAPPWLAGRRLPARLVANDGTVVVVGDWPDEPGAKRWS